MSIIEQIIIIIWFMAFCCFMVF